jgi:hypothetical protein
MAWWNRGPREEVLEAQVGRVAESLGGRMEKLPPLAGLKYRPDRVFLHPGRPPAFLELKRRGERPTPEQEFVLAGLRAQGFVADWADSMERAKAFFDAAMLPPLGMGLDIVRKHRELEDAKLPGWNRRGGHPHERNRKGRGTAGASLGPQEG